MKQNILITGGTGTLGKQIAQQLIGKKYAPVILTSRENAVVEEGAIAAFGNLALGTGLQEAAANADVIIHCASNPRNSAEVDIQGTEHLLASIPSDRSPHIIYISICGVDQSSYVYYQNKYATEKLIEKSRFPYTIIRITQFHDFILHRILVPGSNERESVIELPDNMSFQPIDIRDAAAYIVKCVEDKPERTCVTLGGPEIFSIRELANTYLTRAGKKYAIRDTAVQNDFYNIFRSGINLTPENRAGTITWAKFLQDTL
ncbi:NAD(P)H-binding protein [Chitinophaga filiformis]|uniref:SDR family oxidoreductase n=1 Tax=Chitinophaga filiformis TaxID=104663 RepID=UPI001F1E13B3|nr:NAD(P)H-binding protein [Chitinophaga filiformis]MCF6404861.1 NAD(P)H-binding protein [Chitinophaga filiformis]